MKPNTECKWCKKPIYARPWKIKKNENIYCSQKCFKLSIVKPPIEKTCLACGKIFTYKLTDYPRGKTYCSRSCSNSFVKRRIGTKKGVRNRTNATTYRLIQLYKLFKFKKCMIEGCSYNKCFDIHRLIQGKDGGKYEIGNMFAICPNHHAEFHRGLIEFEKVNDFTLKCKDKKEKSILEKIEYSSDVTGIDPNVSYEKDFFDRRRNINKVFNKCLFCNKETSNIKFCNNKCSTLFRNPHIKIIPTKENLEDDCKKLSLTEIAKKYNIKLSSVLLWVKKHNLILKNKKQAHV